MHQLCSLLLFSFLCASPSMADEGAAEAISMPKPVTVSRRAGDRQFGGRKDLRDAEQDRGATLVCRIVAATAARRGEDWRRPYPAVARTGRRCSVDGPRDPELGLRARVT